MRCTSIVYSFLIFLKLHQFSIAQTIDFEDIATVPGFNSVEGKYSKKFNELIVITDNCEIYYSSDLSENWTQIDDKDISSHTNDCLYPYSKTIIEIQDSSIYFIFQNGVFEYLGNGKVKKNPDISECFGCLMNEYGSLFKQYKDSFFIKKQNESQFKSLCIAPYQSIMKFAIGDILFYEQYDRHSREVSLKRSDKKKPIFQYFSNVYNLSTIANELFNNGPQFTDDQISLNHFDSSYFSKDLGTTWVSELIPEKVRYKKHVELKSDTAFIEIIQQDDSVSIKIQETERKYSRFQLSNYDIHSLSHYVRNQWILFSKNSLYILSSSEVIELKYPKSVPRILSILYAKNNKIYLQTDEFYFSTINGGLSWTKSLINPSNMSYPIKNIVLEKSLPIIDYDSNKNSFSYLDGIQEKKYYFKPADFGQKELYNNFVINKNIVAYRTDSNIYFKKIHAQKWQTVHFPIGTISVWFDPENYVFAATENQIYYTKDKGINWKSFKIPNRINLPNHLYYKNNFFYFTVFDDDKRSEYIKLYRTNDFGKTLQYLDSEFYNSHFVKNYDFIQDEYIQNYNKFYKIPDKNKNQLIELVECEISMSNRFRPSFDYFSLGQDNFIYYKATSRCLQKSKMPISQLLRKE